MKKLDELYRETTRKVYGPSSIGGNPVVVEEHPYREKIPVKTASLGARLVHFIVDWIGANMMLYPVGFILGSTVDTNNETIAMLILAFSLALMFCYYAVSEAVFQQTPAKMLTSSVVVDEYGRKITFGTACLRTLLRLVPFEVFSFLFASRGWHDSWSKTYVIDKNVLKKRLQALQNEEEITYDALIVE